MLAAGEVITNPWYWRLVQNFLSPHLCLGDLLPEYVTDQR